MTASSPPMASTFAPLFQAFSAVALEGFMTTTVQAKPDGSIVTEVDKRASQMALAFLKDHFPGCGIISEEEAQSYLPEAPRQWVVDPLDGTAMYSRGHPIWCMGLGLVEGGAALEGHIHLPVLGATYVCDGERIFLNGALLPPVQPQRLRENTMLMMGSKLHYRLPVNRLRDFKLRDMGSTLYHILSVGLARAEGVITPACHLWDLAPALPFTRSQGMVERHLDGRPFDLAELAAAADRQYRLSSPLIIGPPQVVDRLVELLSAHE